MALKADRSRAACVGLALAGLAHLPLVLGVWLPQHQLWRNLVLSPQQSVSSVRLRSSTCPPRGPGRVHGVSTEVSLRTLPHVLPLRALILLATQAAAAPPLARSCCRRSGACPPCVCVTRDCSWMRFLF